MFLPLFILLTVTVDGKAPGWVELIQRYPRNTAMANEYPPFLPTSALTK